MRDDFHPKRNQARQKLATLPKNRFKDLASDVFFELRRRYPEFDDMDHQQQLPQQAGAPQQHQQQQQQQQVYDEPPAPGPMALGGLYQQQPMPQQKSVGHKVSNSVSSVHSASGTRPTHHRKGSSVGSSGGRMEQLASSSPKGTAANLTSATNDVVVPNKSRLQEEEIEVPYARDTIMELSPPTKGEPIGPSGLRGDFRSDSRSSAHGGAGTTETATSPTGHTDDGGAQYFDRMSFASNVSRSKGMGEGWEDQENKLRAEYEMRIVGLERRLQAAETDRDALAKEIQEEREQRKDYEDEVRGLKERATTHASSLRSVQHELDLARDAHDAVRGQNEQTSVQAQEEISQWRERCEGLEDELRRLEDDRADRATQMARAPAVDDAVVTELQSEVRSLVDELNNLSLRNDELMSEREREMEAAAMLEKKVDEYKQKFNAARTQLRNIKATSTMFISQPLTDDHLPASPDGNIADMNVSAFQQAIDGLLAAARSSQPTGVLPAMKAIVETVTNIGEDVKSFEEAPNLDVDVSRLELLKHESTTRLSSLMTAARNHAMASGLSPVSLLDAAAGHLAANVVEIIKLLKIRRTGSTREILNQRMSMSIGDMVRRRSMMHGNTPDEEDEDDIATSPREERLRENTRANGSGGAGYGAVPTITSPPRANLSAAPPSAYDAPGGLPQFRINSFQSASSTAQRSDSFSLERKGSTASAASDYDAPRSRLVEHKHEASFSSRNAPTPTRAPVNPADLSGSSHSRGASLASATSDSSAPGPATTHDHGGYERYAPYGQQASPDGNGAAGAPGAGGSDQEWDDLKPYLNTQSSTLVNSIQNLLAAIRTGGQGPALNEHLSEVIAISTSIVAVSSNALPSRLRATGDPLLAELVGNTDKLSEAQQTAANAGGFDKQLRQGIASASFGVAKALKALMKVGE